MFARPYPPSLQRGQARQSSKPSGAWKGTGSGSGDSVPRAHTLADIPIVIKPSKKKNKATTSSDSDASSRKLLKPPQKKLDALPAIFPQTETKPTPVIVIPGIEKKSDSPNLDAPPVEDSDGFSSSGKANFSHSETSPKISYAATLNVPPSTNEEELKTLFSDFLNNFPGDKNNTPYYKIVRKIMVECKQYTLTVNFLHIMKQKNCMHLAVAIANDNDREHGWLHGVARDFITDECKGENKQKFTLRFTNKPKSLNPLSKMISLDQLVKKVSIFRGKHVLRVATAHGRHLFLCLLLHILEKHEQGLSWNGELKLNDIYIISYSDSLMECWVTRPTNKQVDEFFPSSCTPLERKNDLVKLDTILTPYYAENGVLPLYFNQLSDDLRSITINLVQKPWYLLYLEYHAALMSSSARKFFIGNLHTDFKSLRLAFHARYGDIFQQHPFRFEWVQTMKLSKHPVLNGVYKHENASGNKYVETFESVLSFVRNVLQHCFKHLHEGESGMEDSDEAELFISYILPALLPDLLKLLLPISKMNDELKKTWSGFTCMRSDMTEPGK